MGLYSVTCHPAEVTYSPLPQPKLVLDLATLGDARRELTQLRYVTPDREIRLQNWFGGLLGFVFRVEVEVSRVAGGGRLQLVWSRL